MRIAIPHQLPREEVCRRLSVRVRSLAGQIPGGMAEVRAGWIDEDRMNIALAALGQTINAEVEVEDTVMVVTVNLPMPLFFMRGKIERTVFDQGTKLLR